jgi:glycosyltransferase involved in cell wall biosynthesis
MNHSMRVLIISNFASAWGGSRGVCEELAQRLEARGHCIFTASRQCHAPRRLFDMMNVAWKNRRLYDVAQLDVFSGPAFFWAEASARVLIAAKKPFVMSLHGGNLPVFARQQPRRVRRLLNSAAFVTAPSEYLRSELGAYRSDIMLLPNPLDLANYPFRVREAPEPRLVWLRAFSEIYNPSLAPRVLALLQNQFPEVHLTMYGPDKGDGSLGRVQQVASELGVESRITFPGGIAKCEVPQKLNEADIFISTTNIDNTPVSVTEAMACGLPVVSTNVGGMPYLITHERDGLLVPPDNASAMAAALARVLAEAGLAATLSRNGRSKMETMDWKTLLPQWEDLLRAATTK